MPSDAGKQSFRYCIASDLSVKWESLVTARTMFAAGLAVIVIVALASVVVLQQIALQRASQSMLQTTTTQNLASATTTPIQTGIPYVLIKYYGFTYTSFGSCNPKSGYIFLILNIHFENHGYDTAPTGSHSGLNFGWYFYLDIDGFQHDSYYLSCMGSSDRLPSTDVLNGLSVWGFLAFEIPAGFRSYSLIYKPETGNYNVRYIDEGFTSVQVQTSMTQRAQEQVILEAYNWTNPSYLFITLRNVGPTSVTFSEFYLDNVRQTLYSFSKNCPSPLPPQQKCRVTIVITAVAIMTGASYPLKIVTSENSVFSYSVIAGGAS